GGGDPEEYAARLASARVGELPPAARAADPVRLLGRSRGARPPPPAGGGAQGVVAASPASAVDHAETAASSISQDVGWRPAEPVADGGQRGPRVRMVDEVLKVDD